mmetsp:Transcript_69123/g.80592  ORF Transcript_69123/g.80592 Transcript_69123/m.80592 type:complete len:214 (+) Transcript_69123:39-680(+)
MRITTYLLVISLFVAVCSADQTTKTPCPFLNTLIAKHFEGRETVSVDELVAAAKLRGIDETLMRTLGNGRAEKDGSVIIKKLLDPTLFPAHRGSMARADFKLGEVDLTRLAKLKEVYAKNGRVTFDQLKAYQAYCWSLSDMGFKDKIPADGEIKLMWDLLGGYKDKSGSVDVNIVYNFLAFNTLPEPFQLNTEDPSTRFKLILSLIAQFLKFW